MREAGTAQGNGTEKIERKWLTKLLYRPLGKVKNLSQGQLGRIIGEYPIIGKLYDTGKSFRETLFAKKPGDLEKWLERADLLGIDGITSFANGIKRDMAAVKDAIELDYNNGLAEGSVNRLKVVKCIMCGRNSFELLRSKLLRLESKRKIN